MSQQERTDQLSKNCHTLSLATRLSRIYFSYAIAALVIGFSASLMLALTAQAATVTSSNTGTGNGSTDINTQTISNTTNSTAISSGKSSNNLDFTVSGGSNQISNNTNVGNIETGSVTNQLQVANNVNDQPVSITAPGPDIVTTTSTNTNTGSSSINDNTTVLNSSSRVVRNQLSTISTQIVESIKNGGNTITNNTTVGNITIGPVTSTTTVATSANSTPPINNGGGMGGGSSAPIGSNQIATALAITNPHPITTASSEFFPSGGNGLIGIYIIAAIIALGFLPGSSLAKQIAAPFTFVSGRPISGAGLSPKTKINKSQRVQKR